MFLQYLFKVKSIKQTSKVKLKMISTESKVRFESLKVHYRPKHLNGSAIFRSVETALEAVLRCETDPKKRQSAQKVVAKYFQTNDPAVCSQLQSESLTIFKEMREWIKYFKYGFLQMTSEIQNYHKFDNLNIMDPLISIQDQIDFHNIIESYRQALLSIKDQFSWPEQFVNQWVQQSKHMKENKIELFKKRQQPKQTNLTQKKTAKRSAPSASSKAEEQTQAGEEPVKKIKKDSVNFRAIVLAIERILEISKGQQKQTLQQRFNEFKQTENVQFLQLLDQVTAKRIFEMRSYIKLFLDAITEATMRPQYSHLAEKDLLEKIFSFQHLVDPDNVFESYKHFFETNYTVMGWPIEMIQGVLRRVVQFKRIEIQYLLK